MKDSPQSGIDTSNPPLGVEGKHPGRNRLQNRLHVTAALIQLLVGFTEFGGGGDNLFAARFQILCHAVKRANQLTEFVSGGSFDSVIKTATGDFLGSFRQSRD